MDDTNFDSDNEEETTIWEYVPRNIPMKIPGFYVAHHITFHTYLGTNQV